MRDGMTAPNSRPTAVRLSRRVLLASVIGAVEAVAGLSPPTAGRACAESATVTADSLRLRSYLWGTVVGAVPVGAGLRVNARTTDADGATWYYVTTGAGQLGWVYGEYVALAGDARARVGIQAGHWRYWEADYPLNLEPGTSAGGYTEADVNLAIALTLSRRLSVRGVAVDLLPTVVPSGYWASAFVAIHSDAGPSYVRGFFVDRPPRSPVAQAEAELAQLIVARHASMTAIPYVRRSTLDSREYYAFRDVDPYTPSVLIETGCLTNSTDRAIIAGQPGLVADGLAEAIDAFLA
jgi:hypothetical protein